MSFARSLSFVSLVFLLATLATVAPAGTTNRSSEGKRIASYCSSSGDICYGIFNRNRRIFLKITTAARYFRRYTLCVTRLPRGPNPEHAQRCGWFPLLRQSESTWGSSVEYARQYVGVGPLGRPLTPLAGRYQVTWRQVCRRCAPSERRHSAGGKPLGPSLYFSWPP